MHSSLIEYRHPPGLTGVELLCLSDPHFEFTSHIHDAYVFWFNGEGGERVSLRGASDILQPDSFGIVAPGEVHANHAITHFRTLESLYVDPETLQTFVQGCGGRLTGFRSRLQKDQHCRQALAFLHGVLMKTDDPFLAGEVFHEIFYLLLKRHGEAVLPEEKLRAPAKVRLAREFMHEHFAESFSLEILAEYCHCSPCHLIRLFRREMGLPPHAYLMELRLARARTLLNHGVGIGQAAQEVGLTDQSHLTRRFRTRFGLTPGQYRKQIS
ncbi:AraC family transcriptional regulator [Pseudodesulfovibrio piezophilus]|uniref:Putative Transcriptional regulator, AraC family n=1 Tax=Pseudodesulfovibrio piezophilus (strain DSM 21447 / JCM 15486 / C1TLV30) TaxID=1322246 RepID=M1WKW0_PSEP2|nr:AraC family transcriptional regulator [Pseudodesulfovibrio piezophilus]CCH50281.1 putative Transcriptional regulator, AraC family [Pseudodesulfovibrio piezophilus C1TLV30]